MMLESPRNQQQRKAVLWRDVKGQERPKKSIGKPSERKTMEEGPSSRWWRDTLNARTHSSKQARCSKTNEKVLYLSSHATLLVSLHVCHWPRPFIKEPQ